MEIVTPNTGSAAPVVAPKTGADRRQHPRYALVMKGVAGHRKLAGSGQLEVIASNISSTGILLHTDSGSMLNEHDLMTLVFAAVHGGGPIELKIRVMWVQPDLSKELGRVSFGCAFHQTSPEDIRRILEPAREAAALRGLEDPY